ncbi:MAG: peptide deformylase [Prolixibacteraceae bacterium]|jgi:peptide deformylase|nr:peptide deformylase [Prolixibacteraceae bacterium]
MKTLLTDMWISMHESDGVGLAAPQVNRSLNLFVINSNKVFKQLNEDTGKTIFASTNKIIVKMFEDLAEKIYDPEHVNL